MHRIITGLLIALIFCQHIHVTAQEDWKQREDKNGITVYSRSSDFSEFDEFKATTTIDQSFHAFVALLQDVDRIPDWMHSVKRSKLLERSGDSIQIYYTEASAPFPLKNRDGVYLNRFKWDGQTRILMVDIEILPDYMEAEKNLVRISRGKGFWQAKELQEGRIELIFQMQVDPGGSIPSWLANMFVVDTPFQTLTKLKELIQEEQYGEVRFGFLE